MPYSRKYDFQAGTRISSSQVDEELNQVVAGLNTLETTKETPAGALTQIQNYKPPQTTLWTGAIYMQEGQTVTPSKKMSECRNGWILVWSDYDPGVGAKNYDFSYSHIPKFIATMHSGAGHLLSVPRTPDGTIVKFVNISDTKIEGNAGNETGDDNDVVLRYVIEW